MAPNLERVEWLWVSVGGEASFCVPYPGNKEALSLEGGIRKVQRDAGTGDLAAAGSAHLHPLFSKTLVRIPSFPSTFPTSPSLCLSFPAPPARPSILSQAFFSLEYMQGVSKASLPPPSAACHSQDSNQEGAPFSPQPRIGWPGLCRGWSSEFQSGQRVPPHKATCGRCEGLVPTPGLPRRWLSLGEGPAPGWVWGGSLAHKDPKLGPGAHLQSLPSVLLSSALCRCGY
jgi:hypothetical protein